MANEEELSRRLAEIENREREVAKREKAVAVNTIRRNLYERITLSKRTLDIIIIVCAVLIVALVIAGVAFRN